MEHSDSLVELYRLFGVTESGVRFESRTWDPMDEDFTTVAQPVRGEAIDLRALDTLWWERATVAGWGADRANADRMPEPCIRGLYAKTAWFYRTCLTTPVHMEGTIDRIVESMCRYALTEECQTDQLFHLLCRELHDGVRDRIALTVLWSQAGIEARYPWEQHARSFGAISEEICRIVDWIARGDSPAALYACVRCAKYLVAAEGAPDDLWSGALPPPVTEFEIYSWPHPPIVHLRQTLTLPVLTCRMREASRCEDLGFAKEEIDGLLHQLETGGKSLERGVDRILQDLGRDEREDAFDTR